MFQLYDNEFSSCSTKVRLALHEKGVSWERHRVSLLHFETKSEAYLKLNPNGVVPTAVVDEVASPLVESHIIIQYIDAVAGGASLVPQEPARRARMQIWLKSIEDAHVSAGAIVGDEVFVPFWRRLGRERLGELLGAASPAYAARIQSVAVNGIPAERVRAARAALRSLFEQAERNLAERRWMMGDEFGLADIALLPYVDSELHAISGLWFGSHPYLARWLQDARSRPSYAAAVLAFPNDPEMVQALSLAPGGAGRTCWSEEAAGQRSATS